MMKLSFTFAFGLVFESFLVEVEFYWQVFCFAFWFSFFSPKRGRKKKSESLVFCFRDFIIYVCALRCAHLAKQKA